MKLKKPFPSTRQHTLKVHAAWLIGSALPLLTTAQTVPALPDATASNTTAASRQATLSSTDLPEITMHVGESFMLPAPQVARVAVGSGSILTANVLDKKDVLFFANTPGTTTVYLWQEDGQYKRIKFVVTAGDTQRTLREITALLTRMPNVKAHPVGDKVIVEGDNLSDTTLKKLELLTARYPQIINFTNTVGWEKMIFLDVKVVEFPKNELKQYGIKWNAMGGAAYGAVWSLGHRGNASGLQVNIPTGSSGSPISISGNTTAPVPITSAMTALGAMNLGIGGLLDLMAQEGKVSVLAEPQLSARNGAKASFLAGGEYPYTVATVSGTTVQFKPYGIKLDIQPFVDQTGAIRAHIESEVSSLDSAFSTTTGPGIQTRKTITDFNVQQGQTLVLSGLLSRRMTESVDKVPLLGDIPILGALFRSKRFQNDETELVVFVTPSIVDSQSPGLIQRVERTQQRLQEQLGPQPYLSAPLQPKHNPAQTNESAPELPPAPAPIQPLPSDLHSPG